MTKTWIEAIDARSAAALASGALQPVAAEQTEMEDAGMRFIVRWVSSLAAKDSAKVITPVANSAATPAATPVAIPGGPRDPNFNPFLNPDPELTVGPIGTEHVVILNKFPLCERHLVLARRAFEEQLKPLAHSDFAALAEIMAEAGGIGLYNGGTAAGASQRHKHVQWMPDTEGNASLRLFAAGLPGDLPEHGVARHPAFPMQHAFVRVRCGQGVPVEVAAGSLLEGFRRACAALELEPGADGLLPPCNLLIHDGWLLMLPRSRECFEGISISAVCFGGTLYTRQRDQIEAIRRVGPLQALAAVGC
jgi:ATP adenylyltransferase